MYTFTFAKMYILKCLKQISRLTDGYRYMKEIFKSEFKDLLGLEFYILFKGIVFYLIG